MDFDQPVIVLASCFLEYLAVGCSLPVSEVEILLSRRAITSQELVKLLASRFDQSRLYADEQRLEELTRNYLAKVVPRSAASDA